MRLFRTKRRSSRACCFVDARHGVTEAACCDALRAVCYGSLSKKEHCLLQYTACCSALVLLVAIVFDCLLRSSNNLFGGPALRTRSTFLSVNHSSDDELSSS